MLDSIKLLEKQDKPIRKKIISINDDNKSLDKSKKLEQSLELDIILDKPKKKINKIQDKEPLEDIIANY